MLIDVVRRKSEGRTIYFGLTTASLHGMVVMVGGDTSSIMVFSQELTREIPRAHEIVCPRHKKITEL